MSSRLDGMDHGFSSHLARPVAGFKNWSSRPDQLGYRVLVLLVPTRLSFKLNLTDVTGMNELE